MILLDTHVVIWLALEPGKISPAAVTAIRRQRSSGINPAISCITMYEIARSSERGRIALDLPISSFLDRVRTFFEVKPISANIAMTAAQLPKDFPSDPADRLIAATAIVEGVPLITADRNIRRSRLVKTIW